VVSDPVEIALVRSALRDLAVLDEVGALPAGAFDTPGCRAAWDILGRAASRGTPVAPEALVAQLARGGHEEPTLDQLTRRPAAPLDKAAGLAGELRDRLARRRLAAAGRSLIQAVDSGEPLADAARGAERALERALSDGAGSGAGADGLVAEAARGGSEVVSVTTGLGLERAVPGGIPIGKVTCMFGPTGGFKSTVVRQLLLNLARRGVPSILWTFEDSAEFVGQWLLGNLANVPTHRVTLGDVDPWDRDHLAEVARVNADSLAKIQVRDYAPPSIEDLVRESRVAVRRSGVRVVAVDYLQMIASPMDPRETSDAMYALQHAARRDDVAYVVVSQEKGDVHWRRVGRDRAPTDTDLRPQLSDPIGSSAIKNACKLAVGVFAPSKWRPSPGKNDRQWHTLAAEQPDVYARLLELCIVKNQLGAEGVGRALVEPSTGRVTPFKGEM